MPNDEGQDSEVVGRVIAMLRSREAAGKVKYGTTLDRDDLNAAQWLQHLLEELLDAANYCVAIQRSSGTFAPPPRGIADPNYVAMDELRGRLDAAVHLCMRKAIDTTASTDSIAFARQVQQVLATGPERMRAPLGPQREIRIGLYNKFTVSRVDGESLPGGKHYGCQYFPLDRTHDEHSIPAMRAYADSVESDNADLARDLRAAASKLEASLHGRPCRNSADGCVNRVHAIGVDHCDACGDR